MAEPVAEPVAASNSMLMDSNRSARSPFTCLITHLTTIGAFAVTQRGHFSLAAAVVKTSAMAARAVTCCARAVCNGVAVELEKHVWRHSLESFGTAHGDGCR